jgi:hypothetical protein
MFGVLVQFVFRSMFLYLHWGVGLGVRALVPERPRLTSPQLVAMNRLLGADPSLVVDHRVKTLVGEVLYQSYEGWAVGIGTMFRRQHYYRCKHIPPDEMGTYARRGLLQAIRCYRPTRPTSMFHLFAYHHVRGELYRGMTELGPISPLTKKERRRRAHPHPHNPDTETPLPTSYSREWLANLADPLNPSPPGPVPPAVLWEHIYDTVDPFTCRCLVYKFDYDFNMVRTNLEVARLMMCSEETVRQRYQTLHTSPLFSGAYETDGYNTFIHQIPCPENTDP